VRLQALAAALALVFLTSSTTLAGNLEGRWRLVEETYGNGGLDLGRDKPPQTIEFVREGGRLTARTRIGPESRPTRPWPAFVIGDAAARVSVSEMLIAPTEDGVRARYTVASFREGDDMVIEVVEDYRLEGDGETLAGTVRVEFLLAGESRGSFVLHRTFERQP
jgi:hypothetical protein